MDPTPNKDCFYTQQNNILSLVTIKNNPTQRLSNTHQLIPI